MRARSYAKGTNLTPHYGQKFKLKRTNDRDAVFCSRKRKSAVQRSRRIFQPGGIEVAFFRGLPVVL